MTSKDSRVKEFDVTDLRNEEVFPNLEHRFSRLIQTDTEVVLERDYLGENSLHYYIDSMKKELIVANNIIDIKEYLEEQERAFTWDRVRAVSNNTRTAIDDIAFELSEAHEEEIEKTLQEYELQNPPDYAHITEVGERVRTLLQQSLESRLNTIPDEEEIGLLLSGGLDSMSIGYLLSQTGRKVTAYTLKVGEDDKDIVTSRELAKRFNMDLSEIKIEESDSGLSITLERYSPERVLRYTKKIAEEIDMNDVVLESLTISGNPKKDNLFCSVAMHLVGKAVNAEGIQAIFSGEGPNEMINDYGFNPRDTGYSTDNKGDVTFREALTFGFKKADRQLGRGGLPKHALSRMGKIFGNHGLRLESPYLDKNIARILTRVPHTTGHDTIKQDIVGAMFRGEGLNRFIEGTVKEKFQDGSGISGLFGSYDQRRLVNMFEEIYHTRKTGYLKPCNQ